MGDWQGVPISYSFFKPYFPYASILWCPELGQLNIGGLDNCDTYFSTMTFIGSNVPHHTILDFKRIDKWKLIILLYKCYYFNRSIILHDSITVISQGSLCPKSPVLPSSAWNGWPRPARSQNWMLMYFIINFSGSQQFSGCSIQNQVELSEWATGRFMHWPSHRQS